MINLDPVDKAILNIIQQDSTKDNQRNGETIKSFYHSNF